MMFNKNMGDLGMGDVIDEPCCAIRETGYHRVIIKRRSSAVILSRNWVFFFVILSRIMDS